MQSAPTGGGSFEHPALGALFVELVRRLIEDSKHEPGELCTPRDAVRLQANLMILFVADRMECGTYTLCHCVCPEAKL